MILINTETKECTECSIKHAANIVGVNAKTMFIWRSDSMERRFPFYKKYGKFEIFFYKEFVKQDKGRRIKKCNVYSR